MKTLIAFLTIFFLSLLAKKVAIGLEEECIQYQEHDEENECQDADRVTRYYYSNETNTCTEYRTCISNETLGHKSVEDCNKKCRTMCPPLPANERFILQSCKDPYNCEAFYKCDGYYFVNGYARTCDNGVWSPIPICSNIAIYHDGVEKDNIEFTSSSFKSETLECKVLPSIPANTEIKWTTVGGNELEGQWNENNTGYQLTITNEGTYSCKVTLTNTKGLKKLIPKSITIKTRDQIDDNLVIHSSNVLKSPDNRQITGQCFCEGTPKPLVSWYINGENYTNEQEIRDAMSSAKTLTLSLLTIVNVDPKIHSGVYTCGCSNSNNSLMGETHTISIPPSTGSTTSRRKRSITTDQDISCDTISKTIIAGRIKRYVTPNLLHVKVDRQTQVTQPAIPSMLKVYTADEEDLNAMKQYKGKQLIMVLNKQDGRYHLLNQILYTEDIYQFVKKQCEF